MNKKDHEEHVKKLSSDFGLSNEYMEVKEILNKNGYNTSGRYAYFFNAGNVTSNIVKRVFLNDYEKYSRNDVQFIPIYIPVQDRIVTLKYWGKYKKFFSAETNEVIQFASDLTCYPSGICNFEELDKELRDDEIKKALGLYWTFSLSLPYEERNLFLGNTFITVGNDELKISKIYHTFIVEQGNNFNYLDINFTLKKVQKPKEQNYMTFILIKSIVLESINKNNNKYNKEIKLVPYYDKGHFNDVDIYSRLAFLILRSMYLKKTIDNFDFLNIGNLKEFKKIFDDLFKKLIIINNNINIKFDVEELFKGKDLEIRKNGRSIRMFIIDDKGDIIFVHPLIAISFLSDSKNSEIYEILVNNILGNSMKRKEFIKTMLDNYSSRHHLLLENVRNLLGYNKLEYIELPKMIRMFKNIYTSVLLNKLDGISN